MGIEDVRYKRYIISDLWISRFFFGDRGQCMTYLSGHPSDGLWEETVLCLLMLLREMNAV